MKSYTAWVCGLSLLFSGSAASASDDSATIGAIYTDTTAIRLDSAEIRNFLDYSNGAFLLNRTNSKLDDIITRTGDTRTKIQSILDFLTYNTGAGSNDNLKYYLQQILRATQGTGDILASNPWWSTNSGFAATVRGWQQAFPSSFPVSPDDGAPGIQGLLQRPLSFPQFASVQFILRSRSAADFFQGSSSLDLEGLFGARDFPHIRDSLNYNRSAILTFDDWLATFLRQYGSVWSNGTFSASAAALTNEIAQAGFTEDHSVTNVPLPTHKDVIREAQNDTLSAQAQARAGGSALSSKVDTLSDMLEGQKDSWITVIPEFDVGGIYVRQYDANMNTPIVQACHGIMFFLWYVILFASLFSLASSEFAFYANLGRNWTVSKGVVHGTGE